MPEVRSRRLSNGRSGVRQDADLGSNSYQLFKRWASRLCTMSRVIARGRIADVREHRLFLNGADTTQHDVAPESTVQLLMPWSVIL
jgi:hypothetical protein